MLKLRPYQQDFVDNVKKAFIDGYKAPCIVAPCGAGKSVMIASVIGSATAKKNHVLFLVHRQELIEQIDKTLRKFGVDMDYVELGMVQTVVRRLDKYPKFKLIVIDENHHVLAKSYTNIIDYFDARVIGFTATPVRLNGDGLGDVNDLLIEGVDAKWLIENGYLAPYIYKSVDLSNKSTLKKNCTGDYSTKSVDESLGNVIYGDVIEHYRKFASGRQTILYAHSREYSRLFAEAFKNEGITSAHLDGDTPKKLRAKTVQDFRDGKIKVLCNVDLIGEGFDVPDCSCVILMRPTASLSLFIQQSMRPMRFQEDKVAVILDHVGNVMRHGLPDMPRIWTLEKKKKRKKNSSEESLPIWECPHCMSVVPKEMIKKEENKITCPMCGHEEIIEIKADKKIDESVELVDITEDIIYKNKNPNDATSYKELVKIAKARGYKTNWAAFKSKQMGFKDTPKWVYKYQPKNYKFNF